MSNSELANSLDLLADLMEIEGADRFRLVSYRRAARTIKECDSDIAELAADDKLGELEGIGKSMKEKIEEYLATGQIAMLEEKLAKFPDGLPALLQIPNLGPKKVAAIHKELGVGCMDDLKRAIESGELANLAGFGAASVKKIAEGIAFLESSGDRVPLGQAMPIADEFVAMVKKIKGVQRVDIGGSLRRGKETIGDIDILCEAGDGEAVVKAFTELKPVKSVLAAGKTKGSVTVAISRDRDIQIDLRAVPAESFGAALQYFTGSKEHNVRVREVAVKKGLKLNEWGLFDGEKQLAGEDEEGIYKVLGLPFVIPELREDRGELDSAIAGHVPIELADIKGDVHMHTVASDGKATIEQMAEAAKARGYEYIAITDHSRSSVIANGLSIERLEEHIAAVRAADKKIDGIKIYSGCEVDILSDGTLDYPDDVLAMCDIVVASIHVAQSGGKKTPTHRTLAAIENPYVTIIGHPTGRLINRRKAMEIDMAEVIAKAASTGTALEINAAWKRLDLNDRHARQAIEGGVMLTIDTDAHHADSLDYMRYGITTARRARVTAANVANTMPLTKFDKWRTKMRAAMT